MRQRGVGQPLEELRLLADPPVERVRVPLGDLRQRRVAQEEVQRVELLPHLAGDRSRTCRAAVRARSMHATSDLGFSRSNASHWRTSAPPRARPRPRRAATAAGRRSVAAQQRRPARRALRRSSARPARGASSRRSAGPRRSPARRSGSSRTCPRRPGRASCLRPRASTQVSLPPPPCDEFTTSEPRRSATRVSPPGVTVTSRPNSTNGRRSTCRPSKWSSTQHGCRDSASVGCAM